MCDAKKIGSWPIKTNSLYTVLCFQEGSILQMVVVYLLDMLDSVYCPVILILWMFLAETLITVNVVEDLIKEGCPYEV